jgi:hypothetical protein
MPNQRNGSTGFAGFLLSSGKSVDGVDSSAFGASGSVSLGFAVVSLGSEVMVKLGWASESGDAIIVLGCVSCCSCPKD